MWGQWGSFQRGEGPLLGSDSRRPFQGTQPVQRRTRVKGPGYHPEDRKTKVVCIGGWGEVFSDQDGPPCLQRSRGRS